MRTPSSSKRRLDLAPPLADRFILGVPHRLRPGTSPQALRIPPYGGHPALRSTASGGFRSVLAVSSFRLRARLDVSIPSTFSKDDEGGSVRLAKNPYIIVRGYWKPDSTRRM